LQRALVSLSLGGTILGILVIMQFAMPEKMARVFNQQFFLKEMEMLSP
jgi:hypothetical protein